MLKDMGKKAREASFLLAEADESRRNGALYAMAEALEADIDNILTQNAQDMANGRAAGLTGALLDRLMLNPARVHAMANGLRDTAQLPDPLGRMLYETRRPNGLLIQRVSTPMGVIAVIFEARPNVSADSAALCVKAGSAVILRGGKEAIASNTAIVQALRRALEQARLPADAVQLVEDTSRDSAQALMKLRGYVDLLVPRGGRGLIQAAMENADVPVLETGEGVCHLYIDKDADIAMAANIADNAKTSRPSVCNAAECLLVHRDIAGRALPAILLRLMDKGVEVRGDEAVRALIPLARPAREDDWGREFLDMVIAVRVMDSLEDAIRHIRRYGSGHSEAIVTNNQAAADRFLAAVDAASVYHNASTRFTDGGEFGFGAEIGISTQKLHARGPVGLNELTTFKYIIKGNGQVR